MKKRILFNCSTNIIGGGIKNSVLFIINTLTDNRFYWRYAISTPVENLLLEKGITIDYRFHIFANSPSTSRVARKALLGLSSKEQFDLVYTMAGPAYVNFKIKHIQGLSNAYLTHANFEVFYLKGSIFSTLRYIVRSFIQFLYSKRADKFIFQTEQARNSYVRRLGAKLENTHVVYNSFDETIADNESVNYKKNNEIRVIFCPGANYIHKGFQYLPKIAYELKKKGIKGIKFRLTLKEDILLKSIIIKAKELGVSEYIENIGPYSYRDVKGLYLESDLVFVPSLLETFSASYLEAIMFEKPLVVADKKFAKEVCGDYALYVNPKDSINSSKALINILNGYNPNYELSKTILSRFGNQRERFVKIITILDNS